MENQLTLPKCKVFFDEEKRTFSFDADHTKGSPIKVSVWSMANLIRALPSAESEMKKVEGSPDWEDGVIFVAPVQENSRSSVKLEASVFNKQAYLFIRAYYRPLQDAPQKEDLAADERIRAFEAALCQRRALQEDAWVPARSIQLRLEDVDSLVDFATYHVTPKAPMELATAAPMH